MFSRILKLQVYDFFKASNSSSLNRFMTVSQLKLDCPERLNVSGDPIRFLIKDNLVVKRQGPGAHQSIILREMPQMYLRQFGYTLRPENFGESNLNGMIVFIYFFFLIIGTSYKLKVS